MKKLIFAFIVFGLVTFHVVMAETPRWTTDPATGCKAWNYNPQPNESVSWTGRCINGYADGLGTLTWYREGIPTQITIFSETNGLIMKEGHYSAALDLNKVRFELKDCYKGAGYRYVEVTVPTAIDLSYWEIVKVLLDEAGRYAEAQCQTGRGIANVEVIIFLEDKTLYPTYSNAGGVIKGVVQARHLNGEWSVYHNRALAKQREEERQRFEPEFQKRREAKLAAKRAKEEKELAAKRAKEEAESKRRTDEIIARKRAFVQKYNIDSWPTSSQLSVNPFAFQNHTVAVYMKFEQMLAADRALMSSGDNFLVVSSVPTKQFMNPSQVLLAGQVLGNTTVKLPLFGEVLVPHLRFSGVHLCTQEDCSEILGE